MNCEAVNELLAAYLDKEVTPEEQRQIEAHLSTCEKCQEELRLLASTREELRQALSAKAAGAEPFPQAWDSVRQRITTKPSLWEQFSSVLNRPVWRAAIPIVLVLIVIGALWGAGILPGFSGGMTSPTPAPTTAPVPTPRPTPPPITVGQPKQDLQVGGTPNVTYSLPGQPVDIELTFTNISSEPITLNLFPPEININPPGSMQTVRSFIAGNTKLNLAPGEVITQTLHWDGKDNFGIQVSPGWYVVNVGTIYVHETPPKTTYQGFGDVARIYVQYPQGAMEKIIEVKQSKTVNGITITLERVELTATEMKLYAFNTPPGYSLPPGQPGPAPSMWIHAEAEYSIDGGTMKQAGPSGIRFLDNGTSHIWDNLDPVPKNAKEVTFRITKLGDWQGPWEFTIQLE